MEANKKDSKGREENKGGLDRCSVRGDRNLPEQKHQQEGIPVGEGSSQIRNYPLWKISYLTRDSQQMDRILLRIIQS